MIRVYIRYNVNHMLLLTFTFLGNTHVSCALYKQHIGNGIYISFSMIYMRVCERNNSDNRSFTPDFFVRI